jgi:hypothetical protein
MMYELSIWLAIEPDGRRGKFFGWACGKKNGIRMAQLPDWRIHRSAGEK